MFSVVRAYSTPKADYIDNFTRANGALGTNWSEVNTGAGSNLTITSNQVVFNGTTDGTEAAIWTQPLLSDHVDIQLQLTGTVNAQWSSVFLGNSTGSACCALRVNSSTVTILSGAYGSLTSRATASVTNATGAFFDLVYDIGTNTYTVLKNSSATSMPTWNDSGNLMSHGSANRYPGIFITRASFANGCAIGYFEAKDL